MRGAYISLFSSQRKKPLKGLCHGCIHFVNIVNYAFLWSMEINVNEENTVKSSYSGHCKDLELVPAFVRVRNSRSLFQTNISNIFLPGI